MPNHTARNLTAHSLPWPHADLEEEIYDKVVDLTEYAKRQRWWNRVFGNNSGPVAEKYSVGTQIAIGGLSGWWAACSRIHTVQNKPAKGRLLLL